MMLSLIFAAVLFETQQGGVGFSVESETSVIDPAKSVFLRVELSAPPGRNAVPPDLRERLVGFSVAEDYAETPRTNKNGTVTQSVNWRLVPEPCAAEYKVKPFVVDVDGGAASFVGGPIRFEPPASREPVTGEMEADPSRDLPPLSWKLVGWIALCLIAVAVVAYALFRLVKLVAQKVKEHRMSPIERAWVELERLLKKGLPGRGKYKDFYVELTMVVRRYIQRKYGIRAPHLTTEEFLAEVVSGGDRLASPARLRQFLESADMVKFAGVEATPDMADEATESAREYLKDDANHACP